MKPTEPTPAVNPDLNSQVNADAAPESAPEADNKSSNRVRKWAFRVVTGAILLAFLLSHRQTALELGHTLRGVSPLAILGAVAFYLAGQWLCAWKWALLLRSRGFSASVTTCAKIYLAGMFANLFLPSNIGGDALRAGLSSRQISQLSVSEALASIVLERLTGFAALLVLAIGGLLARGSAQGDSWRIVGSALVAFVVVGILFWGALHIPYPKVASLRVSLAAYAQPRSRIALVWALLSSLVFQASQVLLNLYLARVVGLGVPSLDFWWLGPILSLSGLLPVGIGGLGVRELAAVGLLPTYTRGVVMGWSLLWQATVWLSSLPGVAFVGSKRLNGKAA